MVLQVTQNWLSGSKYEIKAPYAMSPDYVTIHETGNNAPSANEVSYMIGNNNEVGFHVAIDDKQAVEAIPFSRNTWHCGDGNGNGNRKSIGIEICYQTGSYDQYKKSVDNAIEYVADVLKQFGWGVDRLRRHKDWNGKDCPNGINHSRYLNWDQFKERVNAAMNGAIPAPTPQPNKPSTDPGYGVMIEVPITQKKIVCKVDGGLTAWNSPQDFANRTGRSSDGDVQKKGHYDTINREAFVRRDDESYVLGKSVITGKWIVIGTWYYAGAVGDIGTRAIDELYI